MMKPEDGVKGSDRHSAHVSTLTSDQNVVVAVDWTLASATHSWPERCETSDQVNGQLRTVTMEQYVLSSRDPEAPVVAVSVAKQSYWLYAGSEIMFRI